MTRAEFEAADACPGTRVEWLGVTDETQGGEPLGLVWPRFGFDLDGNFLMADERHSRLVANLLKMLYRSVNDALWAVYTQDAEVGCPTGRHRFPDVVLTEIPTRYADHPHDRRLVLLNPSICIEVLSDSTEEVDLEHKPADYLSIPSVTDYVAVEQRTRRVLHRRRAVDAVPARWEVTRLDAADAVLSLADPAVELPLAEIYARVFPA